ncbi:MAG: permease [Acidobacteria bacterium]|nr:permease [Acidobacteriota bacterium]
MRGNLRHLRFRTERPRPSRRLDFAAALEGPALALLLAGPAPSLPSMLVINSYLGPKKTVTYISLVIVMATVAGVMFGRIAGWLGCLAERSVCRGRSDSDRPRRARIRRCTELKAKMR